MFPRIRTLFSRNLCAVAFFLLLIIGKQALAGGGVLLRNDACIITIGFYTAHFTAYQPQTRGNEEFCEGLPDAAQTIFVLDYLHSSLKEVPVDFRIVRNMTGLGRFAREEDLPSAVELEAHTVVYRAPAIQSDARLSVEHNFDAKGEYIGIVTAGHPTKDTTYTAIFPFEVGASRFSLWPAVLLALVALAVSILFFRRRRLTRVAQ